MPTALDIDVAFDDFGVILDEITSKSALSERDIESLHHALYQQGGLDRRLAARIFHANRIMQTCHDGWSEFYVEALTGFFLEYHGGRFVLPAQPEATLLTWLGDGLSIDHPNERRLIFRIFLKATGTSALIERRLLYAVHENLLHQTERWLGVGERSAGIVDVVDMQLIRRLACGSGGQYPRRSSGAVVTFLLDLDQHVKRFNDFEWWRQLLIDCVVGHLIMKPENGCELAVASHVELEAKIKALFDEGYPSEEATCLQGQILSAIQRCWNRDDGIVVARQ